MNRTRTTRSRLRQPLVLDCAAMPTKTSARTVPEYLRGLDPERRAILFGGEESGQPALCPTATPKG